MLEGDGCVRGFQVHCVRVMTRARFLGQYSNRQPRRDCFELWRIILELRQETMTTAFVEFYVKEDI